MSISSSDTLSLASKPLNKKPYIERKYIPTGGTIVGKVTSNGGYIAGALTVKEQEELVSNAINKGKLKSHIGIKTIGHINAGGSQNITNRDIGKLYKILDNEMNISVKNNNGILITAGTDKLELLAHSLQIMIPSPTIPVVITAAMCPPGGVETGIGTYEDGPVNLRNSELLLEYLEKNDLNKILVFMENKAYQGGNLIKKRPHGIEGAFNTKIGDAPLILQAKNNDYNFIKNSGNEDNLFWSLNEKTKLIPKPQQIPDNFPTLMSNLLTKLDSEHDLGTAIINETGQNNIDKTLMDLAKNHQIIGYNGVGNGNINEKICIPILEDLILKGNYLFIRGTSADGEIVTNEGGEAKNVAIFNKNFPNKHYRLTDFMIPQGRFNIKDATRVVGMVKAMGFTPPQISNKENLEDYLDKYKNYINEVTKCLNSDHPLICTANAINLSKPDKL
jgi:hypothetical protein